MFNLDGRTALVTGATGGIGGAIARALHGAGARVVVTGRRAGALEALAVELGERVQVVAADISAPEAADTLIKAAEAGGGIDILVNNAGLTRDNLALRLKDEDWTVVLETNLLAAFRLSRAALRGMMKRRFGRIVNITSIVGVTGNPGQANYAASKAGLIGMSKSLAQEVASRGVTVNCIAPGFIETAMTADLPEGQRERLLGAIPAGRLGTAADIAAAALYLASEEAAYVTGQTLHVNGGMAMI
jgi:3-oxoacyl-[acyl-carrier protein] reductase